MDGFKDYRSIKVFANTKDASGRFPDGKVYKNAQGEYKITEQDPGEEWRFVSSLSEYREDSFSEGT